MYFLRGKYYSTGVHNEFLTKVVVSRLKKTGVVNVKNPVEAAIEEGRLQEID